MGKIHDFINKDVIAENENKRVIVALRVLYIFEFIAFVLDVLLAGTDVIKTFPYRLGALFLANIFLFTRMKEEHISSTPRTSVW